MRIPAPSLWLSTNRFTSYLSNEMKWFIVSSLPQSEHLHYRLRDLIWTAPVILLPVVCLLSFWSQFMTRMALAQLPEWRKAPDYPKVTFSTLSSSSQTSCRKQSALFLAVRSGILNYGQMHFGNLLFGTRAPLSCYFGLWPMFLQLILDNICFLRLPSLLPLRSILSSQLPILNCTEMTHGNDKSRTSHHWWSLAGIRDLKSSASWISALMRSS